MKKIVSAALVASLVAGAAFADIAVANNIRVRPDLYKITGYTEKETVDAYKDSRLWDLDAFGGNKDSLTFTGKTDYAGMKVDLTLNASSKTAFLVDNWYGWLTWGAFNLTGGVFDSRYTNRGNYTATEQGILDEEFAKGLGISAKNGVGAWKYDGSNKITDKAQTAWLVDFGNVAGINGKKNMALLGDYTFGDVGGGKLLIKGGLVENAEDNGPDDAASSSQAPYDSYNEKGSETSKDGINTKGKDGFYQSAGYVVEAAWEKKDLIRADLIFKNPLNKAYGFGIYITPLMIPNAKNVVVGFTYGTMADVIKTAFAVDVRGTYNITKEATVALGAKFESFEADVSGADTETALQIAAEFSYKVNDLFTGALDFGYFNTDLDGNANVKLGSTDAEKEAAKKKDIGAQFITGSLRGKIFAGKNAALTAAARIQYYLDPADGGTQYVFDIPVVMRIKM